MPDYRFTQDWFRMHAGYWDTIVPHLKRLHGDSLVCVEVGTFEGRAAIYMLDHLVGPSGKLYVIDIFENPEVNATFRHNIGQHPRAAQVEVIKGDVMYALPALAQRLGETVNFLYLDASKTALENAYSLAVGERMLTPNGFMIMDDYMWRAGMDPRLRPHQGANTFAAMTLLCEEVAVPREQAAFRKVRANAFLNTVYD